MICKKKKRSRHIRVNQMDAIKSIDTGEHSHCNINSHLRFIHFIKTRVLCLSSHVINRIKGFIDVVSGCMLSYSETNAGAAASF